MPASPRRKALGQHFLRDGAITARIAETVGELAREHACVTLLEIGPGRGAITDPLLDQVARLPLIRRFILAEKDARLAAEWRVKTATNPKMAVEEADFLDLPEDRWLGPAPLAVASNLPYSVGTAILTRLARHTAEIPFMVLMFQAEVAARLRAEPDSRAWGSLSLWIQNRWDVRKLLSAPPGAFSPPPDVDSEVVVLTRRPVPRIPVSPADEDRWQGLLKAAFAHRRKMLRSGLAAHPDLKAALERAGIDPTLRAEALSWDQWSGWFTAL
jgi:16S rRNA (adenine1518-N6/adenine1519-N6)-dimethyltransferase